MSWSSPRLRLRKKGCATLLSLSIRPSFEQEIIVSQQEDGTYKSEKKQRQITNETKVAHGRIKSSLYIDAANQGVPGKILHEMIRVLSYQVDFQRSVKQGDEFEVMYEVQTDQETGTTIAGDLTYAMLKANGEPIYIYRFNHKNGDVNYYNEQGVSIKKAILQTPVNGARISGEFGWRKKTSGFGLFKDAQGYRLCGAPRDAYYGCRRWVSLKKLAGLARTGNMCA